MPPAEALRWLLHEHPAETEASLGMIRQIITSFDVDAALRESVQLATGVAGCHIGAIYVLDEAGERLWIRATSPGYEQLVDNYSLEVGVGLTGWTALNRVPVMIRDHLQDDPRYTSVPEVDLGFQSALTYPMVTPRDRLVGVLTLHTEAPREFTDEDLILVGPIASLAAAVVETAQLYSRTRRQVDVLRSVGGIGDGLVSPAASRRTLGSLCDAAGRLLEGAVAALYTPGPRGWRLSACSAGAYRPEQEIPGELLDTFADATAMQDLSVAHHELFAAMLPAGDQPSSGLVTPLVAGGENVGLLICLGSGSEITETDRELFGVIATVSAMLIQSGRLVDRLAERNTELAFLEALSENNEPAGVIAARARHLGVDLDELHLAATFEVADPGDGRSEPEHALDRLGLELTKRFPGTVAVRHDVELLALIRVGRTRQAPERIRKALSTVERASRLRMIGGISEPTKQLGQFWRAFSEARDAMRIGGVALGPGHVVRYDDLGAQRHLWALARSSVRDPFQERIEALRAYDNEHRTKFLETVESYLGEHGNRERASARMHVHRNTLRQRIERIRAVSGIDLDDRSIWFDLEVALGIVRFRELQMNQADRA